MVTLCVGRLHLTFGKKLCGRLQLSSHAFLACHKDSVQSEGVPLVLQLDCFVAFTIKVALKSLNRRLRHIKGLFHFAYDVFLCRFNCVLLVAIVTFFDVVNYDEMELLDGNLQGNLVSRPMLPHVTLVVFIDRHCRSLGIAIATVRNLRLLDYKVFFYTVYLLFEMSFSILGLCFETLNGFFLCFKLKLESLKLVLMVTSFSVDFFDSICHI